jgi:hypothetical protein
MDSNDSHCYHLNIEAEGKTPMVHIEPSKLPVIESN